MIEGILSIDPGKKTGIALLTISANPILLHSETINLDKTIPSNAMLQLLHERHCEFRLAYIEQQYVSKNIRTAIKLGQTAGRWHEACAAVAIKVYWVHPQTWQGKMLKGLCSARAKSEQRKAASQHLARLKWKRDLPADEADAAIMGCCCAELLHRERCLR